MSYFPLHQKWLERSPVQQWVLIRVAAAVHVGLGTNAVPSLSPGRPHIYMIWNHLYPPLRLELVVSVHEGLPVVLQLLIPGLLCWDGSYLILF